MVSTGYCPGEVGVMVSTMQEVLGMQFKVRVTRKRRDRKKKGGNNWGGKGGKEEEKGGMKMANTFFLHFQKYCDSDFSSPQALGNDGPSCKVG